MGRLYACTGRLTSKSCGFWPLVPPPVWSTIYLLLQTVASPCFTILNGSRPPPGQWIVDAIVMKGGQGDAPGPALGAQPAPPKGRRKGTVKARAAAGLDEGLPSLYLPRSRLYG
jgi:hypothetical protein